MSSNIKATLAGLQRGVSRTFAAATGQSTLDFGALRSLTPDESDGTLAAVNVPWISGTAEEFRAISDTYEGAELADRKRVVFPDGSWIARRASDGRVIRGFEDGILFRWVDRKGPAPASASPEGLERVLDPAAFFMRSPVARDAFLAAARVQRPEQVNPLSLRLAVEEAGRSFTRVGRDHYQFEDDSFVALDAHGALAFGIDGPREQVLFRGHLTRPSQLPMAEVVSLKPKAVQAFLGRWPSRKALRQAGFAERGPGFYSHPDGSWVGREGLKVLHGVDGTRVDADSFVPPPLPAGAKVERSAKKPRIPRSMKGYALAKIGRVECDTPSAVFEKAGFYSDGNGLWVHADGSWICTQPEISVGWKGHGLKNLPYDFSSGWR